MTPATAWQGTDPFAPSAHDDYALTGAPDGADGVPQEGTAGEEGGEVHGGAAPSSSSNEDDDALATLTRSEVPNGNVALLKAWVTHPERDADQRRRAERVLAAELASDAPRSTLIEWLEAQAPLDE